MILQDKDISSVVSIASSELRYRRLFENAQEGVLILDFKSGKIVDANPFMISLIGYPFRELLGKELWEIGFVIDKELARKAYLELQSKNYIHYEDLPLQHKKGQIIDVDFVINVCDVGREKVIQCNIRDISSQKKLLLYQNLAVSSMDDLVNALVAMSEARDPYTAGHQQRVSELSVAIAKELHYSDANLEGLRMSAMLHDIGKFAMPAEILTKPTALTEDEMGLLRSHVVEGYKILKLIHFPWPVAQTVLQHHERLDGSGYPNRLKGDSISDEARIIGVADTVEALTSSRPYRPAVGLDIALMNIQEESDRLFDPKIVAVCLSLFREKKFKFSPSKLNVTYTVQNVRKSL